MQSSTQNIMRFGNFYRHAVLLNDSPEVLNLLGPDEISFIQGLRAGSDVESVYQQNLDGNINDFFEVRQHIMALLQVWDAVIDEKNLHDAGGRPRHSKFFMRAFLVCMNLVPGRVNIGSLGLGSPGSVLSPLGHSPTVSQEQIKAESSIEGPGGAGPAQTGTSPSDGLFTSSDEDGYETSSYFSDLSGLGLEYDPTQGEGGYGLSSDPFDDSFTIGLGTHGEEQLGSDSINTNTQSGQESQSTKKRTRAEAWGDDDDQISEKPKTRRRLN